MKGRESGQNKNRGSVILLGAVLLPGLLFLAGCADQNAQQGTVPAAEPGVSEAAAEPEAADTAETAAEPEAAEAVGAAAEPETAEEAQEPVPQVVIGEPTVMEEIPLLTITGKPYPEGVGKMVGADVVPTEPNVLTIVFAGDIIFDEWQNPGIHKAKEYGIRACFDEEALEIMDSADLFVINNEFPYTDRGTPLPGKEFTFRCDPETVEWMKDLNADLICLANNHIYDYGYDGVMDTFDTLDEAGLPYIGAGRNLEDATKTAYFVCGGVSVAILNATMIERYENPDTRGAEEDAPGVFRCLDSGRLCEEVRKAKEYADYVIVYDHWGTELMDTADGWQTDQAYELQEAGADLVVGAHPHCLQNIEYIEDMPVIYSIGNYFFSAATRDNGVLRIRLDMHTGKAASIQFIPMVQQHGVRTLEGEEKERVLDFLRGISPGVSIDEEGFVEKDDSEDD